MVLRGDWVVPLSGDDPQSDLDATSGGVSSVFPADRRVRGLRRLVGSALTAILALLVNALSAGNCVAELAAGKIADGWKLSSMRCKIHREYHFNDLFLTHCMVQTTNRAPASPETS